MIAIVDYKAGNLTSVQRALEFLGHKSEITDRPERIAAADRVILPGVGAAGATMENPRSLDGRPLKVPQIGWNRVRQTRAHRVFAGVPDNTHFYFVNSYYPIPDDPSLTIGACDYGLPFTAAIARDNVIATQFHLEKSGAAGLKLLDNFCRMSG